MSELPLSQSTEIWKTCPSFPDYMVSNQGQVKGRKGYMSLHKRGPYLKLNIRKDGKVYHKTVHSLVAETFLGERPKGYAIGHINGKATDNRAENLKYCTYAENEADKKLHGTCPMGEDHQNSKLSNEQVLAIRKIYNLVPVKKKHLIAEMFGVSTQTIKQAANGTLYSSIKETLLEAAAKETRQTLPQYKCSECKDTGFVTWTDQAWGQGLDREVTEKCKCNKETK